MKINILPPVIITPRLLPGVQIGNGFVSVDVNDNAGPKNGRIDVRYAIDVGDYSYEASDLRVLLRKTVHKDALCSLLSLLDAFAEAHRFSQVSGVESENAKLFPAELIGWAITNSDEISMLCHEVDNSNCIEIVDG